MAQGPACHCCRLPSHPQSHTPPSFPPRRPFPLGLYPHLSLYPPPLERERVLFHRPLSPRCRPPLPAQCTRSLCQCCQVRQELKQGLGCVDGCVGWLHGLDPAPASVAKTCTGHLEDAC